MNSNQVLSPKNIHIERFFIIFSVIILAAFSLYGQVHHHFALDLNITFERHQKWMAGNSEFFNPWQYRVLSQLVFEGFIRIFSGFPFGQPEIIAGLTLRYLQNLLIFIFFVQLLKKLQLSQTPLQIIGLILCSYAISSSAFMSDLSFNIYFDIIFYLVGIISILSNSYWILITAITLGALNRETIGLLPFITILFSLEKLDWKPKIKNWTLFYTGLSGFFIYGCIYLGLRYYFGTQPYEGMEGLNSPLDYLKYNLTFFSMYFQLLGTLSILPLLVIFYFRKISAELLVIFVGIVPAWFLIHLFMSLAVETRLFLVPAIVVFIPASLKIVQKVLAKEREIKS